MTVNSKNDISLKFYDNLLFINIILLIVSVTLFVNKLVFGMLTNSIALQADAFDSMTDVVIYLSGIIGFIFANKKPNEKFPYGYYKMENIISLIISLFIFLTAYNIIVQGLKDIINYFNGIPKLTFFLNDVFIFLVISLTLSLLITVYLKYVSKRTNSPILKSEANEKMSDIFISLSVLIGFIGILFNFNLLDSIFGLIIVIFIIKGGYDIFIVSIRTLLDAVIDFENRSELYKMIEGAPKIKQIKKLDIRAYGRFIFLELELILTKKFPLSQINSLTNKLRSDIKHKFPLILKIIIIIDNAEKNETKIAIPLEDSRGLDSKISDHFGESLFFGFIEFQEGNFTKLEIVKNDFINHEKRKGILIADWLSSQKVDKVYLKKDLKKGPSLIFDNNFVEIIIIDFEKLENILNIEKDI
ncbi:MAG: cation diffusion facilitator family transporter [Candidatus Lokiarchaeota archaeon]|nr:cation diffusion facilitator family transporter [Candidatus Lokiarchaeota archaeon]